MSIYTIPVLINNYAYLIVDEKSKLAACVDPVEPAKVLAVAKEKGVQLVTSLTTHSHWDHSGGNKKISKLVTGINIIGGYNDNAPAVTREVKHNDQIIIGNLIIRALYTPCHTPGHVCYLVEATENTPASVFTGDTLFIGGCGNFNDGTPEQMYTNFCETLGQLPHNTLVYVGHEYTVKNLQFGLYAEPKNKAIKAKLKWASERRLQGLPTVPSTIADEWETNPFMRVHQNTIKKFTNKTNPVEVIYMVRKMKDAWGQKKQAKSQL